MLVSGRVSSFFFWGGGWGGCFNPRHPNTPKVRQAGFNLGGGGCNGETPYEVGVYEPIVINGGNYMGPLCKYRDILYI